MGFPGGFGNIQQMMKQAQQMQKQMESASEDLAKTELEASAGGGMVKVVVYGDKRLKEIKIDKAVVDPDDVETLEDLLVAAFNEAYNQADELKKSKMGQFGGLI